MTITTAHATARGARRATLPIICLALATVVSSVASLNVALPAIARATGASQTQLSWVVDAYALVFASLLLPAGAIGDRYGRRKALILGLTLFAGGALAATAYDDIGWLIAMRVVLGVGAALVMPATLSTITGTFAADQRARAVGTWAGVAGASAILGLLASGTVLEQWSWRSVFLVNGALALLALIGTVRVVPESADRDAPRIDWVGAAISVVGLGLLVFSVIEAPTVGWTAGRTVTGLVGGLLAIAAFVTWELRVADPLLNPRLFRQPGFAAGTLTITCQFLAFFGFIFLLLQYLQLVLGDGPLRAALSLVPMALGMMPAARVGGPRLAARLGNARTSMIGLLLASAAMVWLSGLDAGSSYWPLLIGLVPLGAGMGLAMTPATSAITTSLPARQQGIGSAMNDLARELGGAVGIAVLGSVLQSIYRNHLDLHGAPAQVAEQARSSAALALHLDPTIANAARSAFVDGLHTALLVGAGAMLLTAAALAVSSQVMAKSK